MDGPRGIAAMYGHGHEWGANPWQTQAEIIIWNIIIRTGARDSVHSTSVLQDAPVSRGDAFGKTRNEEEFVYGTIVTPFV